MGKALEDYYDMVLKGMVEWMKLHWKGYSIFTIIVWSVSFVVGRKILDI